MSKTPSERGRWTPPNRCLSTARTCLISTTASPSTGAVPQMPAGMEKEEGIGRDSSVYYPLLSSPSPLSVGPRHSQSATLAGGAAALHHAWTLRRRSSVNPLGGAARPPAAPCCCVPVL